MTGTIKPDIVLVQLGENMQFNIEVLAVTVETKPTAKGSYQQLDVAFKKDGKTDGKKIMSFTNKEVFNTLQNAKAGDVFTVTSQKNENSCI